MGGTFITVEIKAGNSFKAFEKKFKQLQESDRIQYGSDPYSGSWANVPGIEECWTMEFRNVKRWTAKTKRQAFDVICRSTEKWEKGKYIFANGSWLVGAWVAT